MEPLLKRMLAQADIRPDASEVVTEIRKESAVKSELGVRAYVKADVVLFLLGRRQHSPIHPRWPGTGHVPG